MTPRYVFNFTLNLQSIPAMYSSASSLLQGTTSFGIHRCDVPITILPPTHASTSASNPNLSVAARLTHASEYTTSSQTTKFDAHPIGGEQTPMILENFEVGCLSALSRTTVSNVGSVKSRIRHTKSISSYKKWILCLIFQHWQFAS